MQAADAFTRQAAALHTPPPNMQWHESCTMTGTKKIIPRQVNRITKGNNLLFAAQQ
jgi:hypothetical protein